MGCFIFLEKGECMYKVVHNNLVIDVLDQPQYFRYLSKSKRSVLSDKSSAHGILSSDLKDKYLLKGRERPEGKTWKEVSIEPITASEYEKYKSLIGKVEITADENALLAARKEKIDYLSKECNKKITEGIGVFLSDKKYHYFNLTIEDQINLAEIENNMLRNSNQEFLYHENGKECQFFSYEDMKTIISAAKKYKKRHTTYFNLMKASINEIINIEDIEKLKYGDEIPNRLYLEKYKSIING